MIWQPDTLPVDRCNLMWLYFAKGTAASMGVGWEERGRHLLNQFRAAAAEHPVDPRFAEFVEALRIESEQFTAWWADNRVERALTGQIAIRRPPAGINPPRLHRAHHLGRAGAHALRPGATPRVGQQEAAPARRIRLTADTSPDALRHVRQPALTEQIRPARRAVIRTGRAGSHRRAGG